MKFLCLHCDRLTDLEQFRVDAAALVLTCSRCGAESRSAPRAAGDKPPPDQERRPGAAQGHVPGRGSAESGSLPGLLDERTAVQSSEVEPRLRGAAPLVPCRDSVTAPAQVDRAMSLQSSPEASNVVTLRTVSARAIEHAARQADASNLFAAPEGFCAKCVAPRAESAAACGHCGLAFAQLEPALVAPPPWLADAWRSLLRSWGDESRHERLRKEAVLRDGIIALARLYRLRLAALPDDPFALSSRAELLKSASTPVMLAGELRQAQSSLSLKAAVMAAVVLLSLVALGTLGYAVLSAGSK